MFDLKTVTSKGGFRLIPLKGKCIKKGEKLNLVKARVNVDGTLITRDKMGKITKIKREGNKMQLEVTFKKVKRIKPPTKRELVFEILKNTDLRKKHLMKLFEMGLEKNFSIKDLEGFIGERIAFSFPKKFRGTFMEGRMFLHANGKYYEM